MSWNDERVELLKKLWSEGLSASQIAGRLGGVTRNAVIGKVHRLGLSGRVSDLRRKHAAPAARASPRRAGRQAASSPPSAIWPLRALYQLEAEPYLPAYEEIEIPLAERKSLLDLTESSCRWPIGDPQAPDFHFCNRSKVTGLPYCEAHARRAFQPPQARRRDREEAVPMRPAVASTPGKEPVEA